VDAARTGRVSSYDSAIVPDVAEQSEWEELPSSTREHRQTDEVNCAQPRNDDTPEEAATAAVRQRGLSPVRWRQLPHDGAVRVLER
jgi:hypothetical protein